MFKNMKLGTKLVFAFLIMAGLVGVVGYSSFLELQKVLGPLTNDIPQGLRDVERTSHLDSLAQKIQDYDQVLFESAREYARKGDRQYKYRYTSFEPRLSAAIREAIEKGDEEDKRIFEGLQQAKRAFVELQVQAIAAMDQGDQVRAAQILENPDYFNAMKEYSRGLERYIDRRGQEYGESLKLTSSRLDTMIASTHALVENAIRRLLMLSTLAALLAVGLGLFVSRSILSPLRALKDGAEIIGKGDLNHSVDEGRGDEIGLLARDFNEMTRKLKESYTGLEDKVRDKTRELARKVEEIEEQNKILEMSKSAMLNVLEDLELAKSEIEEERAKDEAILASIGDAMMAVDADGRIIKVNKQAEVMLGLSAYSMIGRPYHEIVVNEDDHEKRVPLEQSPVKLSLTRGKKVVATAYYVRQDGTRFPAAITVSPILRDGRAMGAIKIFRDISKEKEVDRMKTEFISLASHELRTPLTVIREGVSLVVDEILGPTTGDQRSFLSMVLTDIDRLGRIINNLLDVSKIEAGKMDLRRTFISLTAVAEDVAKAFEAMARNKKLEIRTKWPQKPVELYLDRDKMVQVFTNLVGNAMKFTEKGYIEIGIDEGESGVTCWVRDTGRGISPEDMDKVFKKFQQFGGQTKGGEKGTGLGLTIAKGIVEMHHGAITVESEPGRGTRFSFHLPRETPQKLFQDQLTRELREAMSERENLCIAAFTLKGLTGKKHAAGLTLLEEAVRAALRVSADQILRDDHAVKAVLTGFESGRLEKLIDGIRESFRKKVGESALCGETSEVEVRFAEYPEDGSTGEELISYLDAA